MSTKHLFSTLPPIDEDDLLFEDLLAEEILTVPSELDSYTRDPRRPEVRRLGDRAFLRWLHARLTGRPVSTPRPLTPTACMDEVDLFFTQKPDHTDPDNDFYETDPDGSIFRKATHEAVMSLAIARRMCFQCPIQKACLDDSIVNYRGDGECGIFGGYDAAIRKQFRAHFERMRRGWNKNRISIEERYSLLARAEALMGMEAGALVALDEARRAKGITWASDEDSAEDEAIVLP